MKFHERLTELLLENGITLQMLVEATGKSVRTVSNYRCGNTFPDEQFFAGLRNLIPNYSPLYLLHGMGSKYLPPSPDDPAPSGRRRMIVSRGRKPKNPRQLTFASAGAVSRSEFVQLAEAVVSIAQAVGVEVAFRVNGEAMTQHEEIEVKELRA